MPAERQQPRLAPNLFGVPFGLAGLAQCWLTAHALVAVPHWPADALSVIAGLAWLAILSCYLADVVRGGRLRTELADPTYGPFIALIGMVPMLVGIVLAQHARTAGQAVFLTGLVLTVGLGGWLTAQWTVAETRLSDWHHGYLLPTVAGAFIAAGGSAVLGDASLARFMFGYGTVSWFVLSSVLLLRMLTQPRLPAGLLPTIAIELAPPVVGGTAWFQINGNHLDQVALALAGYALLMVMVQLRVIPLYLRSPFGPGSWAFSFPYSAACTVGIRWLAVEHVGPATAADRRGAAGDQRRDRRSCRGHRPGAAAGHLSPTGDRQAGIGG